MIVFIVLLSLVTSGLCVTEQQEAHLQTIFTALDAGADLSFGNEITQSDLENVLLGKTRGAFVSQWVNLGDDQNIVNCFFERIDTVDDGTTLTSADVAAMFSSWDTNNDDGISKDESDAGITGWYQQCTG